MSTAAALPIERAWSAYQQALFGAVEDPQGRHIVVIAVAGSGKSTSLEEAVCRTPESQSVLVAAFNRDIVLELKNRMPSDADVRTWNSYGARAVVRAYGRVELNPNVVSDQLRHLMPYGRYDSAERKRDVKQARASIKRLVSRAKGALAEPDADVLDALADDAELDFPPAMRARSIALAAELLRRQSEFDGSGAVDFDDQIWLPVVQDLPVPRYHWNFTDETQDLNAAQLELAVRSLLPDGRMVAVGDPRQSIYQFRGADSQAVPRIIARLGAKVLPLSVTYRCARSIVAEAQRIVPEIEAAPGAPDGIVRGATYEMLQRDAAPGDMIVSRTNAPMISLAFQWLTAGRKCKIRGRDIAQGLRAWIEGSGADSIQELQECLDAWKRGEIERLEAMDRSTEAVTDRADCLEALMSGASSVGAVLQRLDRLFDDSGGEGYISLSSTHRAKGLEAERVWLLRDTYTRPRKLKDGTWQPPGTEEFNLLYVAVTRAKRELIYVTKGGS